MEYGVYGSYPKTRYSKNRNYRFGKALRRKGYTRKRVNPINQFTYRKTRVGKYTKTDMQQLQCTFTDRIVLPASSTHYALAGATNQYLNLAYILAQSPEFVSRVTQYSYYMISGMAVIYTRQWMDPIAYGVNGVSSGFLANDYQYGLEMLSTNFYPNLLSTNVGQPVEDADSSWVVSPFIHGAQRHYQPFPKNFTTGTNSNGLGVWNACNQYTNIQGELAIYNAGVSAIPSDVSYIVIWDMEVNLYCTFCNNTGA